MSYKTAAKFNVHKRKALRFEVMRIFPLSKLPFIRRSWKRNTIIVMDDHQICDDPWSRTLFEKNSTKPWRNWIISHFTYIAAMTSFESWMRAWFKWIRFVQICDGEVLFGFSRLSAMGWLWWLSCCREPQEELAPSSRVDSVWSWLISSFYWASSPRLMCGEVCGPCSIYISFQVDNLKNIYLINSIKLYYKISEFQRVHHWATW